MSNTSYSNGMLSFIYLWCPSIKGLCIRCLYILIWNKMKLSIYSIDCLLYWRSSFKSKSYSLQQNGCYWNLLAIINLIYQTPFRIDVICRSVLIGNPERSNDLVEVRSFIAFLKAKRLLDGVQLLRNIDVHFKIKWK